jgi:NTE family protein
MKGDTMFADLVLEGGGVKGIALVGAISVLEERGYQFRRVAGTSAGAIVGSLVSAKIPAPDLEKIMAQVDYKKFQDGHAWHRLHIGKAYSLLFEHGIYEGQYLKDWLSEQLGSYGVHTFADLAYDDPERPPTPECAYRLVVMTSDICQGRLRRLPYEYDHYGLDRAAQPVVDAVRASMSIPFFYKPTHLKDANGNDSWLVDGGMLSNFPIEVFDAPKGQEPRWPTFGIKLSTHPDAVQGTVNDVHDTLSMSLAMLNTMTGFYDRMHVDRDDVAARTIFIDTGKVKATDFDIDPATQNMLFENGRAAALKFLDGGPGQAPWNWDTYRRTYR